MNREHSSSLDTLLIFPPWAGSFKAPEPGLPYLSAYLKSRGFNSRIVDMNVHFLRQYPRAVEDAPPASIAKSRPTAQERRLSPPSLRLQDILDWLDMEQRLYDVFFHSFDGELAAAPSIVGISVCSPTQLPPALLLARHLFMSRPEIPIVLGGPWCSAAEHLLPPLLARFPFIQAAVPFDGEQALERMLRLPAGTSFDGIPGVVTSRLDAARNPPPSMPLDSLPAPDFSDLPLDQYLHRSLPLRTIRGCPWGKCVYCCSLMPGDRRASAPMDPDRTAGDMQAISEKTGLRDFTLANLLTPPHVLLEMALSMKRKDVDVSWTALSRFDEKFTGALLRTLAEAGCRSLMFGLESVDPADQKTLRKGLKLRTVEKNLHDCSEAGIKAEISVMSFPGQSPGAFEETLQFLLNNAGLIATVTVLKFRLPRKCPVYERPELLKLKIVPDEENYDVFNLPFEAGDELSVRQYRKILKHFHADFRRSSAPKWHV